MGEFGGYSPEAGDAQAEMFSERSPEKTKVRNELLNELRGGYCLEDTVEKFSDAGLSLEDAKDEIGKAMAEGIQHIMDENHISASDYTDSARMDDFISKIGNLIRSAEENDVPYDQEETKMVFKKIDEAFRANINKTLPAGSDDESGAMTLDAYKDNDQYWEGIKKQFGIIIGK